MNSSCLLLISLLLVCVAAQQCAPSFPSLSSCVYTAVPPPLTYYIDDTRTTWVTPASVSMIINPDLTVAYTVTGQFTHFPSGGTQFSVSSVLSWQGVWGTHSPSGESCGCSCSGNLLLSAQAQSTVAQCADSYANANPGVYSFCVNYRFLNYYFSGAYKWALNQDATNRFMLLSKEGQQAGGVVGTVFVPYSSTPGAMWGEPVMQFLESGICP